ncbi:phage major capsid protein [Lactiplantibacillus plantarum]|uniref:phage major capsid protein n=1 Tax=Lactiplantibacillus plantarum TaxID=1590 RepID=UPI0005E3F995|nr:phage major capsid protein [Lactiplantibacillus plantarum]CDN29020.1 phage protein, major head protein [Lactiplantibacillus plantarum]
MDLNKLHDAWLEAGQKVADLQDKRQTMAVNLVADQDKYTDEEVKAVSDSLDKVKAARNLAKSAYDDAVEDQKIQKTKTNAVPTGVAISHKKNGKEEFVDQVKDMLRNPNKYNMVSSDGTTDTTSGAGLTIPDDQQTAIKQLVRQYASLESLVNVESVSTLTGTRNIEKFSTITPATKITDQNTDAAEGDYPALTTISYKIADYVDVFYAANDLLNDSAENILEWLNTHIARKDVVTRNNAILSLLPSATKKATIAKFDDIFDTMYSLDSALIGSSTILTNKSGFLALRKVKNAMGDYLVKPDVTQSAFTFQLDGHPINWVEDIWLPDVSAGTHPFYFGNFKELVTIFDRQQMQLLTSTQTDRAFNRNQTAIRSIDRFDAQLVDDEAAVIGSFKAITDQTANFAASAATTTDGK